MHKSLSLLFLCILLSIASMSQTKPEIEKECRITGGIGFGGSTYNTVSVGQYTWFQLSYQFSKNVSIATEIENMGYKLPGYFSQLPPDVNKQNCVDVNFSLLFKYHILLQSKLKIAVASGWTYTVRTSEYYIYESDSISQGWYRDVKSYDAYEIPLLLEIEYPLWKNINVQARGEYNVNGHDGDTYSTGIGLSLKL